LWAALVLAAVGVSVGTVLATSGGSGQSAAAMTGPPGPEGIPLETGQPIASAATAATGRTVDGITCSSGEQLAYHVHSHLSIYVDGTLRPLPGGIGTVAPVTQQTTLGTFYGATSCYYWLHVHAQDGIIHIESPTVRSYTLGQFFDIWQQPLGPGKVASVTGRLNAYVNGQLYRGDPRSIVLGPHEDIQIDVGTPVVAPRVVNWPATGL